MRARLLPALLLTSLSLAQTLVPGPPLAAPIPPKPDLVGTTPTWYVDGWSEGLGLGGRLTTAGDVNGDGYDDVLESGEQADYYATLPGFARLFLGSDHGLGSSSPWGAIGPQNGSMFGYSIAAAGDVNGDGYGDVLVGAPAFETSYPYTNGIPSHAYLYYGTPTGLSPSPAWIGTSARDFDHLGSSVASAGDVNGDGYDDVAIGCDNCESGIGRVYLYLGSPSGLVASPWVGRGEQFGDLYGHKVSPAGDVNHDGFGDLLVSAISHHTNLYQEGRVYLYLGSPTGLQSGPAWISDGGEEGALYGANMAAAGDVNKDGYADVLINAQNHNGVYQGEGKAFVYLGTAGGLSGSPAWTFEGDQQYVSVGAWLGGVGDVNGDGFDDIALGSAGYSATLPQAGRAYVFLGFKDGVLPAPAWTVDGEQQGEAFGTLGPSGDIDGDGLGDVVVGAGGFNGPAGTGAGRIFIFKGQALALVDPDCGTPTQCNGEFLQDGPDGPVLTTDLQKLSQAGVLRSLAVADGVTTLLLREESDEPVTFSILKADGGAADPKYGTLLTRDGSPAGTSVTITPEQTLRGKFAFALYRSPADFPGDDTQVELGVSITIEARTTGASETASLTLFPPPDVLVHGVWSGREVWSTPGGGLRQFLLDSGFEICEQCVVDYGSTTPAGAFDPWAFNTTDQYPVQQLINAVDAARLSLRSRGIAVTQVDVVGHSEGGLVARSRASSRWSPYRTLANYGKGDFHKIITIGTPHKGTPAADFLIENKCAIMGLPIPLFGTLESFFRDHLRKPFGPAVFGFQTGSYSIEHIGATTVPSYSIVGIAPPVSLFSAEDKLNFLLGLAGLGPVTIGSLLGHQGNHDTIVPRDSQQGHPSPTIEVPGVVHAALSDADVGEAGSSDVWQKVKDALMMPLADLAGYPPFQRPNDPLRPFDCIFSSQSPVRPQSSALVSLTPAPGTVVSPGQQVDLTLTVTGGNPVDGAILVVNGDLLVAYGPGPFTFSYTIPANRAGLITIEAGTFGPGPENYGASTSLLTQPADAPTGLQATPAILDLGAIGQQARIIVTGSFADGSHVDFSSPSAGTVYSLLSGGTAVAAVGVDGLIEARGAGQDVVLVSNGALQASARVRVSITNRPPALSPVGDQSLRAATSLLVPLQATDPDGQTLSLGGAGLPAWAAVIDQGGGKGVLRLQPGVGDAGTYSLLVTATDNGSPAMTAGSPLLVTVTPPCLASIPGVPDLSVDGSTLSWASLPDAESYDVIRGDLAAFYISGDFYQTVLACLASRTTATSVEEAIEPGPGEGFYYIVRGTSCAGSGTWDEGGAGQYDTRDYLNGSPAACP